MTAPGAILLSKLLVPETGTPETLGHVRTADDRPDANVLDAAARGTRDGLHLALNIAAMLIAFLGLIALVNLGLGKFGTSLQAIFGWMLAPVAYLMGVPWKDCRAVGGLLGTRTVLNELIAFQELGELHDHLIDRSFVIASFALCGFANFSSIGIQLGGIGALARAAARPGTAGLPRSPGRNPGQLPVGLDRGDSPMSSVCRSRCAGDGSRRGHPGGGPGGASHRRGARLRPELAGRGADRLGGDPLCEGSPLPGSHRRRPRGQRGRGQARRRGLLVLQGRFHYYEGHPLRVVTFPIRVLQFLGVRTLILTAATGGIRAELRPGNLVCLSDHLNLIGANPLRGLHDDRLGPRFPDMTEVYSKRLRSLARDEGKRLGINVISGVYACLPGPSYETPAEIRMLQALGADVVGMSTVPEAIVARHAGMEVLAFALVTNAAAGVIGTPISHQEVLEAGKKATPMLAKLIRRVVLKLSGIEPGKTGLTGDFPGHGRRSLILPIRPDTSYPTRFSTTSSAPASQSARAG